MTIYPAIDIHNGQCVRLVKGDFATVQQVADHPLDAALRFASQGAVWLHLVDLDGAVAGTRVNAPVFLEIAQKSGLRVELGGGIREMETLEYYLSHGIERIILGSAALENPQFVRDAVRRFGERIAVGIDAANGKVATRGWLQHSTIDALELAQQMEKMSVKHIIFTDISRDGTLTGPPLEQLKTLRSSVSCHIIASGGVATLADIQALLPLGMDGAICGKSLYAGTLDLRQALEAAGEQDAG